MNERTSISHFKPDFMPVDSTRYQQRLESLLAVTSHAETLSVFAYNNQQVSEVQPEVIIDGSVAMDSFIEIDTLYRMGVIDKQGTQFSDFGKYVIRSLSLDTVELDQGNLKPVCFTKD